MTFAAEHADALEEIRENGARVTFTLSTAGEYDGSTGKWSGPTDSTVSGYAIRTRGNPRTYERLSLIESESPTLLFAPDTYGELPPQGAKVPWSGQVYKVRDVNPIAPDGVAIIARVVVVR